MSLSSTGGAHELGLRKKICRVRDALLEMNVNGSRNYSKDDLSIALQFYDLDVDRTIQAFLEDGAVEALAEWNKPTRATSRPSASATSLSTVVAQNGDVADTGSASVHSKKKKRKNKMTTATVSNGDSSSSVKTNTNGDGDTVGSHAETDATHDTNEDSSSSLPLAVTNGDSHASGATENGHDVQQLDSNTQINGRASSQPTNDSDALLKAANSLSAGEYFIKAVISANVFEPSDTDANGEVPISETQRAPQRSRAKQIESKKAVREQDSKSPDASGNTAVTQSNRTRNPSGSVSSQRTRTNSTANAIGALIDSLTRSEHELSRFALEFERRRSKCTRDLDGTAARIERQFKAAHDRLDERRRAIASEFASTRTAVEHYLDARSLVATALRERIVRLQTVNPNCLTAADASAQLNGDAVTHLETQVEAVRNEVRALSSTLSRRIDEAAFNTIRFEFDDSTLLSNINSFGHIVPFNSARVGRTMSSTSASATVDLPTQAAPLVDQPLGELSNADDGTLTTKSELDTSVDTNIDVDVDVEVEVDASDGNATEVSRSRSSNEHESRRAFDSRRTVTYSFDVTHNSDSDAALAHNRAATFGGRNFQPNTSASTSASSVEREHSASRRRFNGDFQNPPYEPVAVARSANSIRHSQSHPAYAGDGYANPPNWNNRNSSEYNSTNGVSVSNGYAKRSANTADYAAHNGYAHSNGFANTNSRYTHYSSTSPRAYATTGVQNRFSTFEAPSGRQNSFEFDSRNYAHPRERDTLVFVPRSRHAVSHGTAARVGRPPPSQSNSNGVRTAAIKSDATRLEERDQSEMDKPVAETAPPRAERSEQHAPIDWVNVVEQDEEARRNEALAFVDAPDS